MQLTQISYIGRVSLDLLQEAVAEEILQKTLEGQLFVQALPLVHKVSASMWVQPLVFSFQAEAEEKVVEEATLKVGFGVLDEIMTFPRFDEECFQNMEELIYRDYVKIGEDE